MFVNQLYDYKQNIFHLKTVTSCEFENVPSKSKDKLLLISYHHETQSFLEKVIALNKDILICIKTS